MSRRNFSSPILARAAYFMRGPVFVFTTNRSVNSKLNLSCEKFRCVDLS